jgi:hypothetical protein
MMRRNISPYFYRNWIFILSFLTFISFCFQRIFLETPKSTHEDKIFSYIFPAEVQIPRVCTIPVALTNHKYNSAPVIQFLKCKSSQPLSPQNFNRTRPRGIPVQGPVVRNFNRCGEANLFFPSDYQYLKSADVVFICRIAGCSQNVRPPPFQVEKG